MRINAFLAKTGLGSRRKVESFVSEGRVLINGAKASLASQVEQSDKVTLDGNELSISKKKYFLVYKPVGYTSTVSDEHAEKKVVDLVDEPGLFPVGRLDKDSEGLMILTNDGDFAQKLTHPSYEHEKEYIVTVNLPQKTTSERLENAIKFFKCGIRIDDKKTHPASIKLIAQEMNSAVFRIILKEGLKRQIRRTFAKAGLDVIKLKRVRMASFLLGDLVDGESEEFFPTVQL